MPKLSTTRAAIERETSASVSRYMYMVVFQEFLSSADFFKIKSQKIFQECDQHVKQFGFSTSLVCLSSLHSLSADDTRG